jgi:pimeloyl-ACP methyl ester carboxylesterase
MNKVSKRILGLYFNALAEIAPRAMARQSFKVFSHPIRTKFKKHHLAFLNTANKLNFPFNNLAIQGYKWGHGVKKILFLHGWQSHSFRWRRYIHSLPLNQYSFYAFDAPGHGASEGDMLHLEMYSKLSQSFILKYGPFDTVVAHSMGGLCILYTLFRDSSLQVGRLILMGSPSSGLDFLNFYQKLLNLSQKAIDLTRDYIKNQFDNDIAFYTADRFVQKISNQGLIIHDLDDYDAPYNCAESLHHNWPNSTLITTKGFGHNLQSPKIVELVRSYIENENFTPPERPLVK